MVNDKKEKENPTLEKLAEFNLDEEELITASKILRGKNVRKQKKIILPFAKKHVRFGVVTDTHMTSMFFNKKCLDHLYHVFKEEGAKFVLHAGDITDGEKMHRGQEYHLRCLGADRAVDLVVNEYPDNGLKTHFVIGNHDYAFYKQSGVDIGHLIDAKRKDMNYVGKFEKEMGFEADIDIGKKTMLRLLHPGKGSAKGLSYQPQNIVETLESENKPKILLVGHYHKMDYLFTRNVHAFQAGTTQDQSEWMRTKSIQAHMGGFLLDVYMKEDGTIDRLKYKKIREGW